MNLYELSEQFQYIQDLMESSDLEENPEYAQALKDTFDSIDEAYDSKIENSIKVINQMTMNIALIDDEVKRLQQKKKALSNNVDNFKGYLKDVMTYSGKEKVKTPLFTVWVQNNPQSLKVIDESKIPESYFIPQPSKLDRRKLLSDIKKTGEIIQGTEVVQTRGLRFK
ncbi:siphovirus Gp157 family protein [Facklamia hominis]|uniref:siphovirus Gp157 family protein n=1 Tax=Facklamia hominis TaxID=178214 RepID=UPI0038FCA81C